MNAVDLTLSHLSCSSRKLSTAFQNFWCWFTFQSFTGLFSTLFSLFDLTICVGDHRFTWRCLQKQPGHLYSAKYISKASLDWYDLEFLFRSWYFLVPWKRRMDVSPCSTREIMFWSCFSNGGHVTPFWMHQISHYPLVASPSFFFISSAQVCKQNCHDKISQSCSLI